ncbi:MAG TPA: GNAT family N-acetyltransferase [Caulobacteraceae bacterium]
MILRRANLDDTPGLARLHRHTVLTSLPFLPTLHTLEEEVAWFGDYLFATNEIWLAEAGDEPAGYIAFRPSFVEHLFIRPEGQGAGLGLVLLEKARAAYAELTLWTFQQNEKARRFYERHGFVAVTFTDGADNEEKLPDVLYRWRRDDPSPPV